MSNPNFVNDLVMMAKAYEELPQVKADLDATTHELTESQAAIQRLELRLIDAKAEIESAHAATRKAEVERDHAETMFLETDQRLSALRGIFTHFTYSVDGFIKASEPEPIALAPTPVLPAEPTFDGIEAIHDPAYGTAPDASTTFGSGHPDPFDRADAVPQGESDVDPTSAQASLTTTGTEPSASGSDLPASEDTSTPATPSAPEVATQPDPTSYAPSTEAIPASADTVQTISEPVPSGSADALPTDDVGYHNEPLGEVWEVWALWYDRMNDRYGPHGWPLRNVPSVA